MRPFGTGSRIVIVWTLLCLGVLTGCRSSGIDPTGQRIFAEPPLQSSTASPIGSRPLSWEYPGTELRWDSTQVIVNPSRCVAPIGCDVILLAGVVGPDGSHLRMNQRVEWLLSPDSAGEFVDYDRGTLVDIAFADFNWPRKIDNHWVITSTSRRRLQLNCETPTTTDDVCLARGQTWVTISSPVEGSSHVTAYAPTVYGWQAQKQTATVHWVDAEWQYPSPAVVSAGGRHVFTTTVTRHSDHSPRPGWRVRYEIAGGPPAGFAPDGSPTFEVVTNEKGQASAEIFQTQPGAGTNQVNIQIVRPGIIDGAAGKPLTVNSSSTTITWSAPKLAVRKTGPSVGAVNATLSYRITVINDGDLPADHVRVTDEIPAGTELLGTNPPSESTTGQLLWHIGRLEARQSRFFDVNLRALRSGTVTSCVEATGMGELRARDCVTTVIGTPELAVRILGPNKGTVGEKVEHVIIIENHGEATATGLLIEDYFDPGLEFPGHTSPIKKELPDIAPGGNYQVGIPFQLTRAGNLGHRAEITGDSGLRKTARATINVAPAPLRTPLGGQSPTQLGSRPEITVEKSGPLLPADVGQPARFNIVVRNTGGVPLTNVKIVDSYDPQFRLGQATEGYVDRDNSFIWTIREFPIGQTAKFVAECVCESAAPETNNRVTVTTAEGAEAWDDARVQIRAARESFLPTQPTQPQSSGLSIDVFDLADNVDVGRMVRYEIVVNNTSTVAKKLVLEVDFPVGLKPIDGNLKGYPGVGSSVSGQTIRFQPVEELRTGDRLRYTVNAQATAAGQMEVHARLTSKGQAEPLTDKTETRILGSP